MKERSLLPLLILAVLVVFPWTAGAQEEGYAFRLSNFSLELLGGYTKLNPADLNSAAAYEEAYLQYNYVTRFDYFQSLNGDSYKVTRRRLPDASFRPLSGSNLFGARLRYDLSPSLSLSFGIQYLHRTEISDVGMNVDVLDSTGGHVEDPKESSYQYRNAGFLLSVTAWIPQLAAHFGWDIGRVLRLELLIAGGPLVVQCRSRNERKTNATDSTGFRSDSSNDVDIEGKANGMSGEMGGRLGLKPARFLNIFLEGSYTFRQSDSISGPGSSRTVVADSNVPENSAETSWNGDWTMLLTDSTASWGRFRAYQPQSLVTARKGTPFQKFVLDLSGFQLKAGLSFRI